MNDKPLKISNRDARRLYLHGQSLGSAPTGPLDVLGIINRLGFLQLDTIQIVSRAHHHILWSRNQHYREPMLDRLLGKDRMIFEHFTHDASVLPMTSYPLWRRQFRRMEKKLRHSWRNSMPDEKGITAIRNRIAKEGPLSTHAFDTKFEGKEGVWRRPPHKQALDFMWYAGVLSTSHRQNFTKFYDLSERVIPITIREDERSESEQIDWLCRSALDRLAFASDGEIQRFWEAADLSEVKAWRSSPRNDGINVLVETADGDVVPAVSPADIETRLADLPTPTARLRIINPFDPLIRDRARLLRLFGLDYRIEIFVPAAKRKWGYYVFPLLEGDRFVGRLEARADRRKGRLDILNLWPEPRLRWTSARHEKLESELGRLGRFVGASDIVWSDAAAVG